MLRARAFLDHLASVPVRAARCRGSRGLCHHHLTPPQALFDPAQHETAHEMGVTVAHEVLHAIFPAWSETRVDREALRLMKSPVVRERMYELVATAEMFCLGGGREPLAQAYDEV